jgi:hypothetical protein
LCDPNKIMAGGAAAVVPVRVRMDAVVSAGTGTVRVQSSPCEWVDTTIGTLRGWYTAVGYLETQVAGDHSWATLRVFIRAAGGTLSLYGVSVDFGSWTL